MVHIRSVSWRQLVLRLHLLIGVTLSLPLVVLGLSGSLLVLHHELIEFSAPRVETGQPRAISEILAAAQSAAPAGYVPSLYAAPLREAGPAFVRLSGRRGSVFIDIDPVSLKIFPDEPSSPWLGPLHSLHENLMLPTYQAVGWLGVAMLVLGMSGGVNWWPWRGRLRQGFVAGTDRGGVGLYRRLHATAGIWALLVFMTVSATGIGLAFPQTFAKVISRMSPLRDLRGAAEPVHVVPVPGGQPMPVDAAVTLAQAGVADTRVEYVALPARPDQPIRISLLRIGQLAGAPSINVFIDPWARRIAKTNDPSAYTLGEKLILWQHAIHSGEGLGMAWNFLLFMTGLLPLFFVATGITMWRLKRRAATRMS